MVSFSDPISEIVKAAMEPPTEFGERNYISWDNRENVTHCQVGMYVNRDSEILDRCNWQATINYLNDTYPDTENDDWYVAHISHWACGWFDKLMVKVFIDPDIEPLDELCDEDNITAIYKDMIEFVSGITVYPILDESLYSKMEWEEEIDNVKFNAPNWADIPTDAAEEVVSWLHHHDFCPENQCFSDVEIAWACLSLNLLDPDYYEEIDEWLVKMFTAERGNWRYDSAIKNLVVEFKEWCDSVMAG